jgi:hypothetical protein
MENLIEAFKIFLPCLVIGAVAYFIVKSFLEHANSKAKIEIEVTKAEIIVPARMQAYERIVLFLERITPDNLIRRTLNVTTSARIFQAELISNIRNEYEHNLSQQVYISAAAWTMVKTATEETIRLVNISGSKLPATALATDLAQNILNITSQIGKFPTHIAIENIKKEFSKYFLEQQDKANKKEEA